MLFTMTNARVASGDREGGDIRDNNEIKTVVFPAPVGKDTPILVEPDLSASMQASRQLSW